MNKEDFNSDSDQSDEDFNPEKAEVSEKSASEEDDTDGDFDEQDEKEQQTQLKKNKKKPRTNVGRKTKKQQQTDDSEDEENQEEEKPRPEKRRRTRQTDVTGNGDNATACSAEKDELESDDNEKSRTDALWARFLSDVPTTKKQSTDPATTVKKDSETLSKAETSTAINETENKAESKKVTVTKLFDFAGDTVVVQKTVDADYINKNQDSKRVPPMRGLLTGLKRSGPGTPVSGGLGSVLNTIGKKKKISVLEKSQLDWKSFKQAEGINEQLQTHNKGKDGYLERQDFLQRTDLRQFEIEKSLRQSRRSK